MSVRVKVTEKYNGFVPLSDMCTGQFFEDDDGVPNLFLGLDGDGDPYSMYWDEDGDADFQFFQGRRHDLRVVPLNAEIVLTRVLSGGEDD